MLNAIEHIRLNTPKTIRFSCEIYVYSGNVRRNELDGCACSKFYKQGLWTHFMKAVSSNTTYIAIMMDDVIPNRLDVQSFLNNMEKHRLGMLSASVLPSWNWEAMRYNSSCLLRNTGYADILFATFTQPAFRCWQQMIDLTLNPYGWGYDVAFSQFCQVSVGVSDQHSVTHSTGIPGEAKKERIYNGDTAKLAMWKWLRFALRWHIPDDQSGYSQLADHNNAPAKSCVPRSSFSLADAEYLSQVTHRGGWRTIMQNLISSEVVSLNHRESQLQLIDCSESFFLWNNRVMRKPWVGIVHYTPDLPETFPKFETLQGVLAEKSFRSSLPWCRALIVFSQRNAEYLREMLPGVHIVTMKHPVGISSTPRQFDIGVFEMRRMSRSVAMLGQQYRRLSTLVLLRVKYPKVWLPGNAKLNKARFAELYARDAHAPKKNDLDSFSIVYTKNFDEYDDFVLNNIIVLDVFDAAANNAVLEAIAMANPIFVRRHRAIEEYLGSEYPLFFNTLEEAEFIMNSERDLLEHMRSAHTYLKALPREQFKIEEFASKLKEVANSINAIAIHEAEKIKLCRQPHRYPSSCRSLFSGKTSDGCPAKHSDCSITDARTCAALCKQTSGCASFAVTPKRGCQLCKQNSSQSLFSVNTNFYLMSCLPEDKADKEL